MGWMMVSRYRRHPINLVAHTTAIVIQRLTILRPLTQSRYESNGLVGRSPSHTPYVPIANIPSARPLLRVIASS
jgi:hypothetical protein